jgi:hypothetical protein
VGTISSEASGQDGHNTQMVLQGLITRIAAVSGNPRAACWRFVRQMGITSKRNYRPWTKTEQQKLGPVHTTSTNLG